MICGQDKVARSVGETLATTGQEFAARANAISPRRAAEHLDAAGRSQTLCRTRLTHPHDFCQTYAVGMVCERARGPTCSTATALRSEASRSNVRPGNLLSVSLPMLARWVLTVWGAWLGALGLAAALTAAQVWNVNPILPVGLSVLMLAGLLGLVTAATVRLIRGPGRDSALVGLLVGTAPLWFLLGHILMAMRPAFDRHVPPGWSYKILWPLARPLADLEARWFYPERTPGKWVTMVGARANDAQAQVDAMDRHVERSLARLDQSATWPIVWYRGLLFGLRGFAVYDMAIGSEGGPGQREVDGLTRLDRHEIAHCVITRNCTARSDPPRVLIEGWAQANQGTSEEELAQSAWNDREKGRSLTVRRLVAGSWYAGIQGRRPIIRGGPLVNYLLRVYGRSYGFKLYTTCQQATFEADLQASLGIGLDELEAACWADTEQIVRRTGPPSRAWLKSLKLDPGIDRAAWEAFLADYFAAAERVLAPYDHVRLTTVFRVYGNAQGARPRFEERQELLRSGLLARVRRTNNVDDVAYLAVADRSIMAQRYLRPPAKPWQIGEVPRSSLERTYRRACHGGMILLRYPQEPQDAGFSTDYEVVNFKATRGDGHRLVTLRLRTNPEAKGHREDCTFVFDADDLFVVRSERAEGRVVRGPIRLRPPGRTADLSGPDRDERRVNPAEAVNSPGGHGMPLRTDSGIRVRGGTVPGQPSAVRDHPEAGGGTLDRDAPRLVLAGVRRRRDQPGRWVRSGTESSQRLTSYSSGATFVTDRHPGRFGDDGAKCVTTGARTIFWIRRGMACRRFGLRE